MASNLKKKETIMRKETLRSLRVKVGLTQAEAAKLLGVSVHILRKWERDASNMPLKWAIKVADFYHVPLQRIFFGPESNLSGLVNSKVGTDGSYDHDGN